MQRALLQYDRPRTHDIIRKALKKCGREDLIGNGRDCLVPYPKREQTDGKKTSPKRETRGKNVPAAKKGTVRSKTAKNTKNYKGAKKR